MLLVYNRAEVTLSVVDLKLPKNIELSQEYMEKKSCGASV